MTTSEDQASASSLPPLRVGVLIPPANIACETEYAWGLPAGTTVHFQRLQRSERAITAESLLAMKNSVDAAAQTLAFAPVKVIAYACTSGSFLDGEGLHDEIAKRITSVTGLPSVTTSTAVLSAFRALGEQPVFVIAPYPGAITERSAEFLRSNGIAVNGIHSFDKPDSEGIRSITPDQLQQAVREGIKAHPETRAVFICCTNLPSLGYIAELEKEVGRPIVSSNSATVWAAARLAGKKSALPVLGALGLLPLR